MGRRLEGKVAIITGAARGLGEATARLFARCGARVVVTDIKREGGRAVADSIVADGGGAEFEPCDVTSEADWQRLIATVAARNGRLAILAHNAGPGGQPLRDYDPRAG